MHPRRVKYLPFLSAGFAALGVRSNSEEPRGLKPAARNTKTGNGLRPAAPYSLARHSVVLECLALILLAGCDAGFGLSDDGRPRQTLSLSVLDLDSNPKGERVALDTSPFPGFPIEKKRQATSRAFPRKASPQTDKA